MPSAQPLPASDDSNQTAGSASLVEVFDDRRGNILLWTAAIACVAIAWAASSLLGVPELPGFTGSLFQQSSPIMALVVVALAAAVMTAAAKLIAGKVRPEAAVYCACIGLAVFSFRAGTVRPTYQTAPAAATYLALAFETLLFGAIVLAAVWATMGFRLAASALDDEEHDAATHAQSLLAAAANLAACGVLTFFLASSTDKTQAMAAAGVGAFLASWGVASFMPVRASIYLWPAPIVVGFAGFLANYFLPGLGPVGTPDGPLGPLARLLPIDYATVGVAGSILGFWKATVEIHAEP